MAFHSPTKTSLSYEFAPGTRLFASESNTISGKMTILAGAGKMWAAGQPYCWIDTRVDPSPHGAYQSRPKPYRWFEMAARSRTEHLQ